MRADEIFVLLLLVVCVGAVVVLAVHSKRQRKPSDETVTLSQPAVTEEVAEAVEPRRKRRR
jgi:ABC-type transporter Mla subunit MlaD